MLIMLGQAVLKSIHDIFCTFLVYNYHLRKYFECIVDTKMYFTFIFSLSLAFILKWYQSIKATIHFDISIWNEEMFKDVVNFHRKEALRLNIVCIIIIPYNF